MIVLHIDSGLGNQMLAYCEYLAIKQSNPTEKIYIETLTYEISECDKIISQWNGYELERIFGLKVPNLKDFLSEKEYDYLKLCVYKSHFWEKNWNYSPYVVQALKDLGYNLSNFCRINDEHYKLPKYKQFLRKFNLYPLMIYYYKRYKQIKDTKNYLKKYDDKKYLFSSYHDVYLGQRFSFIYRNNGIEKIYNDIKKSFVFPELDDRNKNLASVLKRTNSVAIHARRGDMLVRAKVYYQGGYFRRAVRYIKKHVENPVFYFFCDPGSSEWCMNNLNIFGLDKKEDNIKFVTWNKGLDSYKDMQLMSMCKHNVMTTSSFGWWGAYLNTNPNKITCTPDWAYNSTNHF